MGRVQEEKRNKGQEGKSNQGCLYSNFCRIYLYDWDLKGEKRMIEFYMEYRRKRGQDILPDGYSLEDLEDDNKLQEIEEVCRKELEHQGVIKW